MESFPISIGKRRSGRAAGVAINIILVVLIVIILAEIVFFSRFRRFYVVGESMYPTLVGAERTVSGRIRSGGDYVYADTQAQPQRGDIVVITTEDGDGQMTTIIKRVIAFGGETVELEGGVLFINGEEIAEPYINPDYNDPDYINNNYGPVTVEAECVFVLGDNRNASNDSRGEYGFIPVGDVVGVVEEWSLDLRWLVTPVCTFFDFTLPSVFSGCGA